MNVKKRIIAFGAHQDDIELRAGGTVAKYVRMGYEVIYVTAIDSVYIASTYNPPGKSVETLSHDDILNIRNSESTKGANILGASKPVSLRLKASYYWTADDKTSRRPCFYGDDEVIEDMKRASGRYFCLEAANIPGCVNEVADFIRKSGASVVLTQQPNDFHLEHYAVSTLAFAACQKLTRQGVDLKLFAWEMGSRGRMIKFVPDVIIDITDTFDIKLEALRCFESQVGPASELHINYAKASAKYWGEKIGVKYAEPFSEMLIAGQVGGFKLGPEDFDYSSRFLGEGYVKYQL